MNQARVVKTILAAAGIGKRDLAEKIDYSVSYVRQVLTEATEYGPSDDFRDRMWQVVDEAVFGPRGKGKGR